MIVPLVAVLLFSTPPDDCRLYEAVKLQQLAGAYTVALSQEAESLRRRFPACDDLYLNEMRFFPDDPDLYVEYFRSAGQDPVILAAILERYDRLQNQLPRSMRDPVALMRRLLWANRLTADAPCPCGGPRRSIKITGYMDEIYAQGGCSRFVILYRVPPLAEEHTIVLTFDDDVALDPQFSRVRNLLKNAGIPHEYRVIFKDTMPDDRPPRRRSREMPPRRP